MILSKVILAKAVRYKIGRNNAEADLDSTKSKNEAYIFEDDIVIF